VCSVAAPPAGEAGAAERDDVLAREAQLLSVRLACARDRLLVTWPGAPSAYLEEALTAPGPGTAFGTHRDREE
jgi:hypothetical protein